MKFIVSYRASTPHKDVFTAIHCIEAESAADVRQFLRDRAYYALIEGNPTFSLREVGEPSEADLTTVSVDDILRPIHPKRYALIAERAARLSRRAPAPIEIHGALYYPLELNVVPLETWFARNHVTAAQQQRLVTNQPFNPILVGDPDEIASRILAGLPSANNTYRDAGHAADTTQC